jgi:predicted nuclease of predicted toxin-antitoxin system
VSSNLRFVADESCDFALVRALRNAGYEVRAIAEEAPSTDDELVLALASYRPAVLVTEDKDFGKLVFASGRGARGVLFVRFPSDRRDGVGEAVLSAIERFAPELERSFVTIKPRSVRARRLPDTAS